MNAYEEPGYGGFAEEVMDDTTRLILADFLEERGHKDYVSYLRSGSPILKEFADYNWSEAFGFAGEPGTCNSSKNVSTAFPESGISLWPFCRKDVRDIFYTYYGTKDEEDWVCVGELWDGRFFSLRAGCDYTGWD